MKGLREVYSGLLSRYKFPKINVAEIIKDNLLTYKRTYEESSH